MSHRKTLISKTVSFNRNTKFIKQLRDILKIILVGVRRRRRPLFVLVLFGLLGVLLVLAVLVLQI